MKATSTRTLTVSLTPQQAAMMESAVESGGYASSSEIVRDALRLWEQREEIRRMEIGSLKKAYDEGLSSGQGREVDADTLLRELKAEARLRG
ncbi:type II toxin-antitoxin system ParD family antitoxin [Neorhizobium lilium]|uniref:Type II toxin-antitoxin system ParD family antitoxin n=1 Tax=Neorhizobium lilium TaxID=2503024 RepID=A0A444LF41_9HYPH|nr:type II toxin-antitoxin system ParD family antitoxin [Neorhizobium lilium]RWX76799.1 type II toxin-antitoxin system ParD family antitoxin [Neorhizobium lilium]